MTTSSTPKSEDEEFVIVQEVHANESETPLIRGTPSQTVRELKEAIANTTESELDEILLAFERSDLNDNDRTLSSYGIENGNEVYFARSVTPRSKDLGTMIKSLFFKNFEGKTFSLADVPTSWTVSALQQRVGLEQGYDPETLRFLWSGKSLESERSLDSYSIRNESTLHIVSRVKGGRSPLRQDTESRMSPT